MKGMVLRRIRDGAPLTRSQLDVAIEQDIIEIQRQWRQFDFEAYTGVDLDTFYKAMMVGMLLNERQVDESTSVYERGQLAGEFEAGLSDDMEWLIDSLPMSTRGFFDKLKQNPEREISAQEFLDSLDKTVVEDHRNKLKGPDISDHQLRA